jgi:peptidase M50B-like protein
MAARLLQINLIVSLALLSWLTMQAVHEFGHVTAAWLTGGRVERVVLYPTVISRTDWTGSRNRLMVVWAGPMVGSIVPIAIWGLAAALRLTATYLARFFAGFCLIANGAYICAGSFFRIGDAGDLIRYGAASWQLWLFGAAACIAGLWLWNGLGPKFGLGQVREHVGKRASLSCLAALVVVVVVELLVGSR